MLTGIYCNSKVVSLKDHYDGSVRGCSLTGDHRECLMVFPLFFLLRGGVRGEFLFGAVSLCLPLSSVKSVYLLRC